ncbi:hypothetical protein OS493_020743 [Desmophyllum pertusum]|uniref:Fibronectin type-III domain-containing protein n=1 Tax=Desmophyllum pertusum TaxID=174260 RepID=A0A9X0CM26_9CNID|nr:hypothetical protein OS493_020743 [Desmophyllum pertusum]
MRICSTFLLVLWVSTLCNNVDGVPSDATVRKARCYANCLTQNAATNETEKPCQTSACKECLIPCGTYFSDKETCIQSCKNASSCEKSCEFLTQLQNFSSILDGDGSIPPTPGIPTVTNKTITSISLRWDPVQNASGIPVQNMSGTAVYLIEVTFTGEKSIYSPSFRSEVFVTTQATLKFEHPCFYIQTQIRYVYEDILYRFKVAVLTENSSISYGPQTAQITLSKPDPVTNVTLDSLIYDVASSSDKIKLTVSWVPSNEQKDLISMFGMMWSMNSTCSKYALPRAHDTSGPQTTASMHVWHESRKCVHTLQIYSIIGCSVSDPTEIKYTYPGCQKITDYPANECYKFDPPYAPLEDRMVSNIRLDGQMTAQPDYRFQVTVTWDQPVYPYKNVERYLIQWFKENGMGRSGFTFTGFAATSNNGQQLSNLLPGTTYRIKIRPMFVDGFPMSGWTYANFTTPACNCLIDGICCEECDNEIPPPISE